MNGHDRCDVGQCGAQAYVRVELKSGELFFCGHHFQIQPVALQSASVSIHDERKLIGASRLDVSA